MDVVELLSKLVSIRSVNDQLRGEKPSREIADFIASTLRGWGIESRIIEVEGYYTVFGEIGEGEPLLMFMAHFDTVPVREEEWSYPPFKLTVVGDRGYGRGAADDKSNVASVMLALRELVQRGGLRGRILFAFTGDEEIGGRRGAGYLAEGLRRRNELPRYMVNADGFGLAVIARRRAAFRAEVSVARRVERVSCVSRERRVFTVDTPVAPTRHAAYFMPGVDRHPLIAASHFLRVNEGLRLLSLSGSFVAPNVVPEKVELEVCREGEGGEELEIDVGLESLIKAVVPLVRAPIPTKLYSDYGVSITPNRYYANGDRHVLTLDIRAFSDRDAVEGVLREVLNNNVEGAELSVGGGTGWLYTPRDARIVKVFTEVLEEVGEKPRVVEGGGASDARWFSPLGVEVVDFGPRGGNIHGADEYVDIPSLRKLPRIYVEVARRLLTP